MQMAEQVLRRKVRGAPKPSSAVFCPPPPRPRPNFLTTHWTTGTIRKRRWSSPSRINRGRVWQMLVVIYRRPVAHPEGCRVGDGACTVLQLIRSAFNHGEGAIVKAREWLLGRFSSFWQTTDGICNFCPISQLDRKSTTRLALAAFSYAYNLLLSEAVSSAVFPFRRPFISPASKTYPYNAYIDPWNAPVTGLELHQTS